MVGRGNGLHQVCGQRGERDREGEEEGVREGGRVTGTGRQGGGGGGGKSENKRRRIRWEAENKESVERIRREESQTEGKKEGRGKANHKQGEKRRNQLKSHLEVRFKSI